MLKGGGHAMAAGFEAREEQLGALQAFIAARFKDDLDGTPLMPTLLVDGALQARAASPDLIATLERLAPFGAGNAEPRFVFPAQRVAMADIVGTDHVRCVLTGPDGGRLKAIAFRVAGEDIGPRAAGEPRRRASCRRPAETRQLAGPRPGANPDRRCGICRRLSLRLE